MNDTYRMCDRSFETAEYWAAYLEAEDAYLHPGGHASDDAFEAEEEDQMIDVVCDEHVSDADMQQFAEAIRFTTFRVSDVGYDEFIPTSDAPESSVSAAFFAAMESDASAFADLAQNETDTSDIGRLCSKIGQLLVPSVQNAANIGAFDVYDGYDRSETAPSLIEALRIAMRWVADDTEMGAVYDVSLGGDVEDSFVFFENTAADRTPDASLLGVEYDGRPVGIHIASVAAAPSYWITHPHKTCALDLSSVRLAVMKSDGVAIERVGIVDALEDFWTDLKAVSDADPTHEYMEWIVDPYTDSPEGEQTIAGLVTGFAQEFNEDDEAAYRRGDYPPFDPTQLPRGVFVYALDDMDENTRLAVEYAFIHNAMQYGGIGLTQAGHYFTRTQIVNGHEGFMLDLNHGNLHPDSIAQDIAMEIDPALEKDRVWANDPLSDTITL